VQENTTSVASKTTRPCKKTTNFVASLDGFGGCSPRKESSWEAHAGEAQRERKHQQLANHKSAMLALESGKKQGSNEKGKPSPASTNT
jgi:hypothetical protein